MFPRSLHAYFYDVFTTTPDSDIVDCLVGFGAFGGQELPPGFPGQPDYYYGECFPTNADYWFGTFALEDLGDGFDTYSISGSVGVHVTNLYVFKTGKNQYDEQCVKIEHLCCTPCWPDGLPTTCTVTIAGASGTYHTGLFPGTDCDRGEFNGAYVCDHSNETPTDFGCYYQFGPEFHDHMNPPVSDCDILFMDIGVFLSADVDMNFSIAVSMSTKMAGGNGTWIPDTPGETVYGPEGICAGTVIPLKPESGTAAATVTLQFG
jgi:hypothetical protein